MKLSLLLPAVVSAWPWSHPPRAATEYGDVEGFTNEKKGERDVDVFWGIPYAAAPVGDLRFRPPQPFDKPWSEVRKATKEAEKCAQLDLALGIHWGSEDCLTLDIYRPRGADENSSMPVLVWIYGGGYFVGSSRELSGGAALLPPIAHMYDGSNLVHRHEQVFVSMNYRLSGFGFMALPELADADGTTGNYGVQDQRAALQFVQRNVRQFGGDPKQVTIAGESAGAFSVMWHLVSKESRGLYHAAIMESTNDRVNWFFQNKSQAFEFYGDFAQEHGCSGDDRVACLRKTPTRKLMISFAQIAKDYLARHLHLPLPKDIPDFAPGLFPIMPFGPVIDGSDAGLLDVPIHLVERGEFSKVPLIVGSNKDGGAYFGPAMPGLWGGAHWDMEKLTKWAFPQEEDQKQAQALYGGDEFTSNATRFAVLVQDLMFKCTNRDLATQWSKQGVPVYQYVFSFNFTGKEMQLLGDAHVFEVPFVFRNKVDTFARFSKAGRKEDYEAMEDIMSCSWASFVKCQQPRCLEPPPHCEGLQVPEWPVFGPERHYYSLRLPPKVKTVPKAARHPHDEMPGDDKCDFFAQASTDFQHIRPGPVKAVLV